ncbi:MAG: NAD(P)H-dependent oxidoreductase subunit E [Deltaproteobacteria bacterium]|nr:NAD(P)H-dependent oxidoreductase subunit E [Deltaproteobacteria bacterium]
MGEGGAAGAVKRGSVLVVGGGIGGIQTSLDLADQGFKVYLVERGQSIGGKMVQLDKTFPTNDCAMCMISPKLVACARHPNIEILTMAEVQGVAGTAGDFRVNVRQEPRSVDREKCTGCGTCMTECPVRNVVEVPPPAPPPVPLKADDETFLEGLMDDLAGEPGALLPILQRINRRYHHLPRPLLEHVSHHLGFPLARVLRVATFYKSFSLVPRGDHEIKVCLGTACHLKGSAKIIWALGNELKIAAGETTRDRKFTLETSNCRGACALAPMVVLDGEFHSGLTQDTAKRVIKIAEAKSAGRDKERETAPLGPATKFGSTSQLDAFRDEIRAARDPSRPSVVLCGGSGCTAGGAEEVTAAFEMEFKAAGLQGKVTLKKTGCHGLCQRGPVVLVHPRGVLYQRVKPSRVSEIVARTISGGQVIEDLLYDSPFEEKRIELASEIPFYKRQTRLTLGNIGRIDPTDIEDFIAEDGFAGLARALAMNPPGVIDEITGSGLRGRGGGGFATGRKWAECRAATGNIKYIICNIGEVDRSLLEGDPFSVLEGMTIGAYAVGASKGYIYVRLEYPLAIRNLHLAIASARAHGLLGQNILGSGLSFDVLVKEGAGGYVCGEETALIASIEGRTGEPSPRPPYPATSGLWGKPTVVNNVKTWVMAARILARGASWHASKGLGGDKGTMVFSLVGKVRNTGLAEVPLGTTLRELVVDIGGGISTGKSVKALQTGGPLGGCIPVGQLDLPADYEHLEAAGSMMGSGSVSVMDEDVCMVDVARYSLDFAEAESCGKCTPCREGTQRLSEILNRICGGRGREGDIDILERLARGVKSASLCGLGKMASNPVITTLRHFRREYERHVEDKRCDAYVCKDLVGAPCASTCPLGTEAWRYIAHIARGEWEESYRVLRETNPFPSVCARVCNHPCERRCRSGTTGKQPIAIRALKRFVTDRVDPMIVRHPAVTRDDASENRVAIIGSGPAGLAAAHHLSLQGYRSTVFEMDDRAGGMLFACIPAYRLPKDVLEREIASLLDGNVTLRCDTMLGRDVSLDGLLAEGYKAIFLAMGAHKSRRLDLPGEDAPGVYPSIRFLKAANLRGESLGRGRVGVVGGGNSAFDAARMALRQPGVESVTLYYRRTREEIPAFAEEIEAALQEGVRLETLTSPTRIELREGRIAGVTCVRNVLGSPDASGRPRPVPVSGSEYTVPLDTLVVAISEGSDTDCVAVAGVNRVEVHRDGRVKADHRSMMTSRTGVFAGGDVVRGPNTVVDAIADGKKAAAIIGRYLRGEPLHRPGEANIPRIYVEPALLSEEEFERAERAETPRLSAERRKEGFGEVEMVLSEDEAVREARRCLRCDLEFTRPKTPKGS